MKLSEVADRLFSIPGITDAFMQQTEALNEIRGKRVSGGGGAFYSEHTRTREFRLVLTYKPDGEAKTTGECVRREGQGATLHDAIADALERAKMPVPDWLPKVRAYEPNPPQLDAKIYPLKT